MIAAVNPGGDVMTVEALEKELVKLGCEKRGPCTNRTCIWRTANGKHFSAPNPETMYLVPSKSLDRLQTIIAVLVHIRK